MLSCRCVGNGVSSAAKNEGCLNVLKEGSSLKYKITLTYESRQFPDGRQVVGGRFKMLDYIKDTDNALFVANSDEVT